ncbi:thioester reductase domain-containing protein [Ralstonia nicotianae]
MDSVLDCLEHWARLQPENVLFEFRDIAGAAVARHTYGSMLAAVDGLAARLLEHGRFRHGDRVLLAHGPGLGTIVSLLGCARAGLIAVPVALPARADDAAMRRLRAIAANCSAVAVLSEGAQLHRLRDLLAACPETAGLAVQDSAAGSPDGAAGRSGVLRRAVGAASQPVLFLQYTSGSTGRPRGVVVSHRNVIANAGATVEGSPVGVSWLPAHHDMGLIGYTLFPLVSGGASYGMAPADFLHTPAAWLRLISEVRATHTSAPDFGYDYCLRPGKIDDGEIAGIDLGCLRAMMSGGERVRPATVRRFLERFARYGLRREACVASYGLAEATLNVAHEGRGSLCFSREALRGHRAVIAAPGEASVEIASCGRPAPGVVVSIAPAKGAVIDAAGAPAANGQAHAAVAMAPEDPSGARVGEICVQGESVTAGYWNDAASAGGALRTGDLGFLWQGELYVCGRQKELMIVAGANFYPEDMEEAVHASGAAVRPRGVCAFQDAQGQVILLAEPRRVEALPDPAELAQAARRAAGLMPDRVELVAPRSIALTTSGKLARAETRAAWAAGALRVLASHRCGAAPGLVPEGRQYASWRQGLRDVLGRYGAAGPVNAALPLSALGIDSLGLASIQVELEALLRQHGSGAVAEALDAPLLQQVSLNGLLAALAPLDRGRAEGAPQALASIEQLKAAFDSAVGSRMQADLQLDTQPLPQARASLPAEPGRAGTAILLTGATGFFGPFLLHALLRQTERDVIVLVRARDPVHAMERIDEALRRAYLPSPAPRTRVRAVCGDLALPRFGLADEAWDRLAAETAEVFHNGACVNYVMTYDAMRPANVEGTRSVLRLARHGGARRTVHLVSSTFIFGWSARGVLLETDCNAAMQALDFGYAQTKWVAEQMAMAARADGLDVRIYRPSLISVSTRGAGDTDDVALRMLAFMIRHGVAVDTPNQLSIVAADVIAHNMVGISRNAASASALHFTADRYYSMTELTRVIERDYGATFRYYDIPRFIDELNRRCSDRDPVFPLLDFFNRSADKIAAMQLKRYSSEHYQQARAALADPMMDPSLAQTAAYLMRYLRERGWVEPAPALPH